MFMFPNSGVIKNTQTKPSSTNQKTNHQNPRNKTKTTFRKVFLTVQASLKNLVFS